MASVEIPVQRFPVYWEIITGGYTLVTTTAADKSLGKTKSFL